MDAAPRVLVVDSPDELAAAGADLVTDVMEANREAAVVMAMGRTPMGLYEELAERHRSGSFDPAGVTVFQLDEYLGLPSNDRRSLLGWLRRSFLDPLGIDGDRVVRLPVDGDLDGACAAFDRTLRARGGLDLAVLGLGPNGHVGFNEPPSDRDAATRDVVLTAPTVEANAGYWGGVGDVPTRAVTMGMSSLLSARRIVLVVSGEGKRSILRRTLEGPVDPTVPASFLREVGSRVTVIADRAAWGDR
jgi:glucosamine-6-phosphate deaminase